jgi:hypothetical protein
MKHSKRRLFHMQQHWNHTSEYAWWSDVKATYNGSPNTPIYRDEKY